MLLFLNISTSGVLCALPLAVVIDSRLWRVARLSGLFCLRHVNYWTGHNLLDKDEQEKVVKG